MALAWPKGKEAVMKVDLRFELTPSEGVETEEGVKGRTAIVRVDPGDLKDVELEVVEARADGTSKKLGWCKLDLSTLLSFFKKE